MVTSLRRREFLGTAAVAAAAAGCRRAGESVSAYAFIANAAGKSVAVIDLAVFAVIKRIALEADPVEVLSWPGLARVLALSTADGNLTEISASRHTVTRRLHLGANPRRMHLAEDRNTLVVQTDTRLILVDLAAWRVKSHVGLSERPADFDVPVESMWATATLASKRQVAIISIPEHRVTRYVTTPYRPGTVRFLKNGSQILVGQPEANLLSIYDTLSGEAVVHLPLAVRPERFCFSADLGQLFVNGAGSDSLAVVYPFQTQVAATLLAGHEPGAMAASANPAYLFVANSTSNSVTVVDVPTQRVIGAVPVGQGPSHIAVTPDSQFALVLNRDSGDIAVLTTQAFGKVIRRDRSAPLFLMIPAGSAPTSAAFVYLRA